MKARELREMQAQFLSGNYEKPRQSERAIVDRANREHKAAYHLATPKQVKFLNDLRGHHPDHANTVGIHSTSDLTKLTRRAASDAISYILNESP